MKENNEEQSKTKDLDRDLTMAVQKLVMERLGNLDITLLGNRIYRKPTREMADSYIKEKLIPRLQAKIILEKSELELGENAHFEIELQNIGKTPVQIARIENFVPTSFELADHAEVFTFVNNYLDMHGMKIDPYLTENIEITLRSTQKGTFILAPRISYTSEMSLQMSCKPEPASINVTETILPNRTRTGFKDLDNLLFGGIPQKYAAILISASCDERDLLIKRYIEAGTKDQERTLYVTVDATGVKGLVEDFSENFNVLVCNPEIDESFRNLPNVSKVAGVENLTELNIMLESMLQKSQKSSREHKGRICVEILSDVLLQHHAVQTRRWLSRLIPQLRSNGFTTLAVANPHMHSSEELHAVLDLFEGEISIYEKKAKEDLTKYLRIRKMHNQRYLETELPLRKTRLMTMPLALSCCTRTFNL